MKPDGRAGRRRLEPLWVAAVLSLAFIPGPASARNDVSRQGTVEFSYGRYGIADPLFKTIYQPSGALQGLGFTAALMPHIDFYFDLKLMINNGLLSHSQEETDFVLLPISLGLRGALTFAFFRPFIGAGFDYFAFLESNPIGTVTDRAVGWHLSGGFYLQFGDRFPILPFFKIKQTFVKAEADTGTINLGGFEWGGGLAIAF
ncbi:MAG: hypothetical protein JW843_03450 [Candidatus Aminicenantes bacterium]|nr:hypothetical protein [Candidatus Aminicenantes bacterium]